MKNRTTPEISILLKQTLKDVESKMHLEASCMLLKDSVNEFSFSSNEMTAFVNDNQSASKYFVKLDFTQTQLKSNCTCSKQHMCRHIAATILYGLDNFRYRVADPIKTDPTPQSSSSTISAVDISPSKVVQFSSFTEPEKRSQQVLEKYKFTPLNNDDKINDPKVSSWISKLEEQNDTTEINKNPIERKKFLAFYLSFGIKNSLAVSLYFITLSKNEQTYTRAGGILIDLLQPGNSFQKIKPFLIDEEWRIISILMQKGIYADDKKKNFLLTFPGSVELIKLLAETGRCFFDPFGKQCLKWGQELPAHFDWSLIDGTESHKLNLNFEHEGATLIQNSEPLCYMIPASSTIGLVKLEEASHLVRHLLSAPPISSEDVAMVKKALKSKVPLLSEKLTVSTNYEILDVSPTPHLILRCIRNNYGEEVIVADIKFKYGEFTLDFNEKHLKSKSKVSVIIKKPQSEESIKIIRKSDVEKEQLGYFIESELWRFNDSSLKADFICDLDEEGEYDDEDDDEDDWFWDNDEEDYDDDDELTLLERAEYLLTEDVPMLEEMGWTVTIDPSFPLNGVYDGDEWYCDSGTEDFSLSNDWFDISLGVLINGERINMLPTLKKFVEMLSDKKLLKEFESKGSDETLPFMTHDKKKINVPVGRIRNIAHLLMVEFSSGISSEKLKISKWNSAFLEEFVQGETAAKGRWMGSEGLQKFAQNIRDSANAPLEEPSKNLLCELRPYQKEGYNWMQFLRRSGMNGILADDMGLGKTVQTLAHLIQEKESGRMTQPAIIVAPTSLIPNWFNEIKRFAPSLSILILHGEERKSLFGKIGEHDIILTTYPLLMRDKEFLLQHEFYILVLDEAQTVKNHKTQAFQVLQQLRTRYRICLSGTPMENHLGELWSLFHFLLPGFLGDQKTFQTIYRKPIEKDLSKARREALFKRIKPFILRRTKQQVALDLPEKTEIIQRVEFKSKQRDLYEAIRIKAQAQLMQQIDKKGLAGSQIAMLDALLKLRQVCCDSRLVKVNGKESIEDSAKLDCLKEMLSQMLEEGRKILIFSQFTSMLALIEAELIKEKISYTILTGNTKDRDTPVKKFQNNEVDVMLISLKAGGVGLNLTAADTVIHYDPWWNPAVENQATDRAHRMGQKKAVFVYKLVVNGSIEEKILVLQERKKNLVSSLLDSTDTTNAQVTLEDLEMIFQPLPPPI